jgi:SNF2 family DNA or RNA helicase
MPMSKADLKNMVSSLNTYQKGAAYQKNGRVTIVKSSCENGGVHAVSALVSGSAGIRHHVFVRMSPDDCEVLGSGCDCPDFESCAGICKHIVATVLEIAEMPAPQFLPAPAVPILDRQAGTETGGESGMDVQAVELMQRYVQKSAAQALTPSIEDPAFLEPILEFGNGAARLRFKIGEKRSYILKDIAKFTHDMRTGAVVAYGKQFSMRHYLSSFMESSRPLVRYVMEQFHESDTNYFKYDTYYSPTEAKKYMFLSPYMLDEFMKLFMGQKITVTRHYENRYFQVREENPHLTVKLSKKRNSGFELNLDAEVDLLSGMDRLYVFCGDTVYCCDTAYGEACTDFLKIMSASRRALFFSNENMKALASVVLVEIKPFIEVISNVDLIAFEPLPLVTRVYFDMPSSNIVTARMRFCYGDEDHSAFLPKRLSESADIKGEYHAESILQKYFKNQGKTAEYLFINSDEDAVYNLFADGINEISGFAEIYATDSFKKIQVRPPVAASVGVRLHSGLLEMDFDLDGLNRSDLLDVLHSYRQAKKFHRLRDGSFLNLQSDSLAEFSELASGLDLSDKEILSGKVSVPKYRALYLDILMKQSEEIKYDRDGEFKKIVRDIKDVSDADFAVPTSLKSILRNYQKTGYQWLRTISAYDFGGILADDMGLGKTLQVLALLLSQKNENQEHSLSLVVCPSSLVLNWESEANRFTPELRTVAVAGPAAQRAELLQSFGDADLLITSYDSLKRDIEQYKDLYFQFEIIDEAQYVKNYNTQNAKAVKVVKSRVRFALTGTPVENSLAELWSIYDYLMPGYLYSYGKFRKKLEAPIVQSNESDAVEKLRRLVLPFILRRLKKDVLKELPEKTETVLYAEMTEEQEKLYLANVTLTKEKLTQEFEASESSQNKFMILSMLTKLRQLCCDPSLLYDNYQGGSAKLELCMELVESCVEAGHKLLLFSQFTSMLQIIEKKLQTAGIGFYKLTGSTNPSERLALVNTFNADQTPVFLISLKAGGTGLNLTGADVVIHYDPWWNVSAQNQASDRVHRIGQKNNVQIYKLIAKKTIEEKILKMQRNKAELADKIIQEGDNALAKMTREEIMNLFE